MSNYPIITFGAYGDEWSKAYEFGKVLAERFPNEDAGSFAMAIEYNDHPFGATEWSVTNLKMLQEGERDGDAWIWQVLVLADGESQVWNVTGWCDYTGWDCRSGLSWNKEGTDESHQYYSR